MNIGLGDKVKHEITGFEGVVIAETRWLNGCLRYVVQPEGLTKDGATIRAETFDAPELKVTKPRVVKEEARTGGPRDEIESARR